MSGLKNAADCTSQRLKWTSGARVMILVFDDYASKRQGVQAFKRSSVQAFKRSSIQAFKCSSVQAFKRSSAQASKRSSDQAIKLSSEQAFKRSSENQTISGIKQKLDHPVDNPVVEMRYRMILPKHRMPCCNPVFVSHDKVLLTRTILNF